MAVKSITGVRSGRTKPMPARDGCAGTDGGARAVVMHQPIKDASDAEHGGRKSGRALHGVHALRRAALGLDMPQIQLVQLLRSARSAPVCARQLLKPSLVPGPRCGTLGRSRDVRMCRCCVRTMLVLLSRVPRSCPCT
jgi:hypothetical protein